MKGSAGLAASIYICKLFFTFLVKVFANTNKGFIFVLPNAMKRAGKQEKMKLTIKQLAYLSNYQTHVFTANGYLWKQWTDHNGNVMHTEKICNEKR